MNPANGLRSRQRANQSPSSIVLLNRDLRSNLDHDYDHDGKIETVSSFPIVPLNRDLSSTFDYDYDDEFRLRIGSVYDRMSSS